MHRSLGHASWNRKVSKKHRLTDDPVRMPPIVDFTTETAKDREWDNIAAIHRCFGINQPFLKRVLLCWFQQDSLSFPGVKVRQQPGHMGTQRWVI